MRRKRDWKRASECRLFNLGSTLIQAAFDLSNRFVRLPHGLQVVAPEVVRLCIVRIELLSPTELPGCGGPVPVINQSAGAQGNVSLCQ